jgi:hypothetical protein
MSAHRARTPVRFLVAAVAFAAALMVPFHGIIADPGSRVTGFGDATGTLRNYWADSMQHRDPFNLTRDALLAAPEGTPGTPATVLANGGIQAVFVWELRGLFGLIGAWNAFMLLGLFATAMAMFAFLDRLGCTLAASLLGGYVFAFSPYALERGYAGHLSLLHNWVFVLLAAALVRLRARRTPLAGALAGSVIALAFYLSAYQGLLAGFMALVFFGVELARLGVAGQRIRTLWLALSTYLVCLIAMTPIFVLYAGEHSAVIAATSHGSGDLYVFAAKLSAYFVPSPRNPLFHWLRGVHSASLTEETLFVGYLMLSLALAAVVLVRRGDPWFAGSPSRRATAIFLAVLAPAAFVFSLPPSYHLGSLSVPMPSATIGHLSGLWRVYSRFGLLFDFAVVVLGSLGLSALARRPGRRWRYLTPVALVVAFLEILPGNVPTLAATQSAQPGWVRWLAAEPGGIVASYPWVFGTQQLKDEWYSIFDRDPQFDLYLQPSASEIVGRQMGIRLLAKDVHTPLAAEVLSTEGVRYVVVHDDAYVAAGQSPPALDPADYTLLKRFPDVRIFSVHAPKVSIDDELAANATTLAALQGIIAPPLGYGSGFNSPEPFKGGSGRWMVQNGELTLANAARAEEITITGLAFSNQAPRVLELRAADGRILARQRIPGYAVALHLPPVAIPAGTTTLTLVALPGPAALGASDPREASVFLASLSAIALPGYIASSR